MRNEDEQAKQRVSKLENGLVRLVNERRYRAAQAKLAKLLDAQPDNLTAHFQATLLELQRGCPSEATKHARLVLRLNPDEPNAWLNLGVSLQQRGQIARAINCYRRELLRDPESRETLFNLGICLVRRRRWVDAIFPLKECLRLRHSLDEVTVLLAKSFYKCGLVDEEIGLYEKILLESPDNLWARSNLGAALMDKGNYRRALIQLRIAKARGCEFPNLLRNLRRLSLHERKGTSQPGERRQDKVR